jgi:hypothetical protein
MMLHGVLLDGFKDDDVTIAVGGRVVYRKSGVTTNLAISHADSFHADTAGPRVTVNVEVAGGPNGALDVDVARTPFVAVKVQAGRVTFQQAAEPFPML